MGAGLVMTFRPKPPADNELCMRVASRIREARIVAGLTALQVVEASGLSRSTYYVYETAEGSFQITALAKIAPVIGCTLSELLMTDEEVQQQIAARAVADAAASLVSVLRSYHADHPSYTHPNDPSHAWREFLAIKQKAAPHQIDKPI